MTTVTELVTRVNDLKKRVDDASGAQTTSSDKLNSTQTDIEGKAESAKPCPTEASGYKTRAEAAKPKVTAIPGINDIAKELHKFAVPEPDFCLPLISNLDLERGFGDVSFSRSTTATYIDKSGVLRTAGVNEPRFEREGILIEGSSTNLLPDSNNVRWNGGVTEKGNPGLDGVTPMTRVEGRQAGSDLLYSWFNVGFAFNVTPKEGDKYTASVYLRPEKVTDLWNMIVVEYQTTDSVKTPHNYLFIDFANMEVKPSDQPDGTRNSGSITYINNGIYRVSNTITLGANASGRLEFRIYNRGSSRVMEAEYGQIEKLPFATSYIPTTGSAVTRVTDVLEFPFYQNMPDSKAPCTIDMTLDWKSDPSIGSQPFYAHGGANTSGKNGYYHVYCKYSSQKGISEIRWDNGYTTGSTDLVFTGQHHYAFGYDGTNIFDYVDSKKIRHKAYTPDGMEGKNYAGIRLGVHFYGHLRNFRIWHRALTDDQIAML